MVGDQSIGVADDEQVGTHDPDPVGFGAAWRTRAVDFDVTVVVAEERDLFVERRRSPTVSVFA